MRLFHGSNVAIDTINFAKCRPYKDFGKGFYLTTIKEQAEKMATRVARIYGVDTLVKEMEYKKLTGQYSFHTDKAIQYLKKVGVLHE